MGRERVGKRALRWRRSWMEERGVEEGKQSYSFSSPYMIAGIDVMEGTLSHRCKEPHVLLSSALLTGYHEMPSSAIAGGGWSPHTSSSALVLLQVHSCKPEPPVSAIPFFSISASFWHRFTAGRRLPSSKPCEGAAASCSTSPAPANIFISPSVPKAGPTSTGCLLQLAPEMQLQSNSSKEASTAMG